MNKSCRTILAAVVCLTLQVSCRIAAVQSDVLPRKILWAWERPENLEFINGQEYAVAFLSQTLVLNGEEVSFRPRRQPLKVNAETKLIAVTRIEAEKTAKTRHALSANQQKAIVARIVKTLNLKNVAAIQIDFDAAVSEREFYRNLLIELRAQLPAHVPLSITALASFCVGDRWLSDLPVAEAVPMIFRMGADDQKIKNFLANGNDFAEPLCRKSYGVATDEPLAAKLDPQRRLYIFKAAANGWSAADLEKLTF